MDVDDVSDKTLKEEILLFLDKTDQVSHITQRCNDRLSQTGEKGQVLLFEVCISISDLTEVSSSLTNAILHNPDKVQGLFQEVIYTTLKTLEHLPENYSLAQIQVTLRVSDLPSLPCYRISIGQLLKCHFESRYYTLCGFACSKTPPQEYSKSTRYFCRVKDCKGSQGNAFIRLYNRGSPESQVIRRDFQCTYCGQVLQEDVHARVLGEKVVVQIVGVSDRTTDLQGSFSITLRDGLQSSVRIGNLYAVVGIPQVDFCKENQVQVNFEASSVIQVPKLQLHMPDRMLKLHDCSTPPWCFSRSLAYMFASEIAPSGTFHLLKMCILLSIVQTGNSNKVNSRLDILAIGREDQIIDRLFQYGAKFLPCYHHGNIHPLFPSVRESQFGSLVDGGAILFAGDRVCLLGDIGVKKKDTQEKLSRVLQEKCLMVDVAKRGNDKKKEILQFTVESTIWAYQERKESTGAHISGAFSLVVDCDSQCSSGDEYIQSQLCQDILMKTINSSRHHDEPVTFEDFQKFLLTVASRNLTFSEEAESLLKGYFVTSRKIHEGSPKKRHFPLSALQTLSSLAMAHGKLTLQDQVTEEDAVVAIHIFEECLSAKFGPSFLNIHHQPHLQDDSMSVSCGPKFDHYMSQFQSQLKRFCNPTDITGLSKFISED